MDGLEIADYETPCDNDIFITADGCWLWRGRWNKDGYGLLDTPSGTQYAHIHFYEAKNGRRPIGKVLDHLCRRRACCNPEHVEPVTGRENTLRGRGPSAVNARKTHCPKGHPYDEQNTIVRKNGGRVCRLCYGPSSMRSVAAVATEDSSASKPSPVVNLDKEAPANLDAKIRQAWKTMRQNCSNPNRPNFDIYGGKGIRVCEDWDKRFAVFRDWALSCGCEPGLVLKRTDRSKDFTPDNCNWVRKDDAKYITAAPREVTAWGETKRVADWARDPRSGVSEQTIGYRLDRGWAEESAISTPPGGKREMNG